MVNSLFELERNGYNETIQLLEYHKESTERELKAFFGNYYHNQWIDHPHFSDETVIEIVDGSDGIDYVIGNEYNRKGRMIYTGSYRKGQYDGEGIYFNPDQSYDKGMFDSGKRSGVFETFTDRSIVRRAHYSNNVLNGICTEFYNSLDADGNHRVRAIYNYINGKLCGIGKEYDGYGGLLFKGMFEDGVRNGEGCEYLSAHLCKRGQFRGNNLQNWEWCVKKTPDLDITEIEKYKFSDSYYRDDPIPLLGQDGGNLVIFSTGSSVTNSNSTAHFCTYWDAMRMNE